MMVTFVSQCEKKAINKTRRVLDSFANRIGSRTWQTVITNEGLNAVKKNLRRTASKNTAVSCHWLRSRSRTELVWIVGNRNKFNEQGIVPVNLTQDDVLKSGWENKMHNTEVVSLLSGIAGLFHDFGKANQLFQNKLDPKCKGKNFEPYRHEWVSLRLFQAFVGKRSDIDWLTSLKNLTEADELIVLSRLKKDPLKAINSPLTSLPPIAKLVAWLIVSHHKLPVYPKEKANAPELTYIGQWLNSSFGSIWNSVNSLDEWEEKIRNDNWFFPHGTPLLSMKWREKAEQLASRALRCQKLHQQDWFNSCFTAHLSRLVLMLADHYYSSLGPTTKWQDVRYKSFANTDCGELKQKLDEHNIGVSTNAYLLALKLPNLKTDLPTLGYDQKFIRPTNMRKYLWQNKAFDLAKQLSEQSESYGFFGINMASTGLGKTLSNARIMYGLSGEKKGCRFNVAVGLRALTLQTGDALAERLSLDETELAVLIGSQAIKRLHQSNKQANNAELKKNESNGSESLETLLAEEYHVKYKGAINDGILSKWLSKKPQLEKLLNAPVLVSTIDYLVPATEGARGGKQIAPMLRLLSSDLVLDEPDDFGLEDLPALCRLVNWAGMLGSRVLLSTATMPPALAYALFEAYQAGRKDYTAVNGDLGVSEKICCAWFDEYTCTHAIISTIDKFKVNHTKYVDKRIEKLKRELQTLRKACLLPISSSSPDETIRAMSLTIYDAIHLLHTSHHQKNTKGNTVSVGLVRMANINPLVAISKALFSLTPQKDHRIHYCVYHSQFPLAVRSYIEQRLDATLTRHNEEDLWKLEEIKNVLETYPEKHHIFVVLATSVAEVGRDHDYDWAVAEPSSMRSLIQLAGRIQRHRKKEPKTENLFILSKNYKALNNEVPAYCRPGFETEKRQLAGHDLCEILKPEYYRQINAIPRIKKPQKPELKNGQYLDFVQLEQFALYQRLLGEMKEKNHAKYWWSEHVTWCAELQKIQPFRQSPPEATYCLYTEEEDEEPIWTRKDETSKPITYIKTEIIRTDEITMVVGNQVWLSLNADDIYLNLSQRLEVNMKYVSKVFGELGLREDPKKVIEWLYHPILGVYGKC